MVGRVRPSFLMVQVLFLIALQVVATALLWALNPVGQSGTNTFALYLSIDLLSFAILSYVYRSQKQDGRSSQAWIAMGYLAILVLLASDLALT